MKLNEHNILFVNKSEISSHTVEEAHSLKLNNWRDWYCSAGIRALYIHHDGLVYRGTCGVGGSFGSIYNEGIDVVDQLQYSWVKCDRDVCACGSDMKSPKVKNIEDTSIASTHRINKIDYSNLTVVDQVTNPDMIFCGEYSDHKLVIWEIGRRCNYDCWYCFPDSHNNYESHKTLGSLMHGLKNLSKSWATETDGESDKMIPSKMKFVFTGGEPTFNPDFLEFVTHLHDDLLHIAHTTTNGSHTPDYYAKLMKVSDIGFSAHLHYLETPNIYKKFLKNIESAANTKLNNRSASYNWLGVRIMLQPGKLEFAKQLYNDCKAITKIVEVDLLHGRDKKILPYSQEEIDWMINTNNNV